MAPAPGDGPLRLSNVRPRSSTRSSHLAASGHPPPRPPPFGGGAVPARPPREPPREGKAPTTTSSSPTFYPGEKTPCWEFGGKGPSRLLADDCQQPSVLRIRYVIHVSQCIRAVYLSTIHCPFVSVRISVHQGHPLDDTCIKTCITIVLAPMMMIHSDKL